MRWRALCLVVGLAACGSPGEVDNRRDLLLAGLRSLDPRPSEAPGIAEIRAFVPEALARTEGGLVLVEQPDFDRAEFFGAAGRNDGIVTYGSDSQTSIALDGPVMVATRGFGGDVMSADIGPLPELLAARQAGRYTRVLRHLDGEDRTTQTRLDCDLRPSDDDGAVLVEYCGSAALEIRNVYRFGADGNVTLSEQWHGAQNGYLILRHLR